MQSASGMFLPFLKTVFPFYLLAEDELAELSTRVERRSLAKGTVLFRYGEKADYFYIIHSGSVKIQCKCKGKETDLSLLTAGDVFGEEALHADAERTTLAVCTTPVVLLRFSTVYLQELAESKPLIKNAFQLLLSSSRLNQKLDLSWRTPEEPVLLVTRRHPFFLVLRTTLLGLASLAVFSLLLYFSFTSRTLSVFLLFTSILSLIFGLFLAAWAAAEWTNDYLFITRERVITQRQIIGFFEGRQESPMSAILSTGTDSSVWGRTIGFGTMVVRSYTGDLRMEKLPHPELIYGFLEAIRQRITLESKREEQAHIQEALTRRLHPESVHTPPIASQVNAKPSEGIYDSESIGDLLARFFGLRTEQNGSIVYHTHWAILIKKTFLPALLLLAVVVSVILKLSGFLAMFSENLVYGAGLAATLIGWGWWIYQYIDWHNDVYIITADQLVDLNRRPLGWEEKRSAPLKNIQTVEYKRNGLIGLILNFGTVSIKIGNEELTFDNVYKPSSVQREVYARFAAYNEKMKRNEQERLADWIQTYDRMNRTDTGKMDQKGVK